MWDDALLYEAENADDPAFDLGWWQGLVARRGARRVLELACGTGRLTIPLARGGADVTGLDSSSAFLARARELAASEADDVRARLRWVLGDMRACGGVGGPFELVAIPYHSLHYLHTVEDQLACLRAGAGLLAPGGALAFDLLMPRLDYLAEAHARVPVLRLDTDHAAPQQGFARILRSAADSYDAATQTLRSTNTYQLHHLDGRVEHRVDDLDWHMYFPRELSLLLGSAGLRAVERFGGYSGEPWGPRSAHCLWVCEPLA